MTSPTLIGVLGFVSVVTFVGSHWLARKSGQNKFLGFLKTDWLQTTLQVIYFLGLPYLTLITGLLPARFLGLKGVELFIIPDLNRSISGIFGALFIQAGHILFIWLPDFGPMAFSSALLGGVFVVYLGFYLRAIRPARMTIYQAKMAIIFDVVHWAFYRAIIWFATGSIYLGFLGGLILIMLEYLLAGYWGKFSNTQQQQFLFRFGLGLLTSITFLFAPNLWFTLIFQGILVMVSQGMFKTVAQARITATS